MLPSPTKLDEQLDYSFLLIVQLVCADRQIHSEEVKALQDIAILTDVGQKTLEEMEKIFSQDDSQLSVEYIANQVLPEQQNETMRQMLAMAYVDDHFSPLERELVDQVAQIWNWHIQQVQKLIDNAECLSIFAQTGEEKADKQNLSISARLLQGCDSILSRALVDKVVKIAPENIGVKIQQLRREILLAGPEYDQVIQQCALVANQDYKYAELALQPALSTLSQLVEDLQIVIQKIKQNVDNKGQATTAKDVANQLEKTQENLTAEIIKEFESVRESLQAKQRAVNHFSIAFMGKTKAGKSTLHSIITDEGWEAIGVGKQRTTRFNRVYEWKNIRIIDTPGIGAPGGKTDEEIAQSVIEESDVICYLVTNDSIQETEFNFLKFLKEKNKPLIILLNVKNNLRDSRRLESFLKSPDKIFSLDGNSGLKGHIDRIRRYARQYYANDYFEVIPLLLLAAQMSSEPEHQKLKEQLFKASRIQDFLDSIRVSLVEQGAIRRSQTLLGSTVGSIEKPEQWVAHQKQVYRQLIDILKSKQEIIKKQIERAAKDNKESLSQQIAKIFQDTLNAIPSFAENNWNYNKLELEQAWKQKLTEIRFEERLNNVYEQITQKFNDDVKEALEEIGNELQLIAKLNSNNFSFQQQDSTNYRDFVRIGAGILLGAGTVLTFLAPPVGIVSIAVGTIFSLIVGKLKSTDEKRRKAVQNISTNLTSQINNYRENNIQEAQTNFDQQYNSVATEINSYFKILIAGLEDITKHLETAENELSKKTKYLNWAYSKRIIDWVCEQSEPLTDQNINKTIAKVKRKFGSSLEIHTKSQMPIKKSQDVLKRVLQEDTTIQFIKPSQQE